MIKEWIERCVSTHEGSPCDSIAEGVPPKRLIYLDSNTLTGHLVDTTSPVPPYVALSYVWGPPEHSLMTKKSNLGQMYRDVPLDRLPLTLQHVFEVVRNLDIQHLWIDALCIVQDDEEDKATEISNMAYTYWSARLQIAAMASPGASHGLLSGIRDYSPEERDGHHHIMKACRSLRQNVWDGQLRRDYPLLTRGWTFQERILARRCVHFTAFELVWECKRARWCECGTIEYNVGVTNLINNMSAAFEVCVKLDSMVLEKIVPMWRECVMSYSKRNLSKPEDRLLAISGIASMLRGPEGGGQYLAGLWRDAMPFELLWRCDQSSGLTSSKTRKPTWSWCSVNCGVDWPTVRSSRVVGCESNRPMHAKPEFESSLDYIASGTYFERELTGVSLLSAQAQPQGAGFGPVEAGTVVLSARSVPVRARRHARVENWRQCHETEWIIEGLDGEVLPFYPDVQLSDETGYMFVEVASFRQGTQGWEAGLVVERGRSSPRTYERVGMAGYNKCGPRECPKGWFEDAVYNYVTLM